MLILKQTMTQKTKTRKLYKNINTYDRKTQKTEHDYTKIWYREQHSESTEIQQGEQQPELHKSKHYYDSINIPSYESRLSCAYFYGKKIFNVVPTISSDSEMGSSIEQILYKFTLS